MKTALSLTVKSCVLAIVLSLFGCGSDTKSEQTVSIQADWPQAFALASANRSVRLTIPHFAAPANSAFTVYLDDGSRKYLLGRFAMSGVSNKNVTLELLPVLRSLGAAPTSHFQLSIVADQPCKFSCDPAVVTF